jgi:hypothetical protein
MPEPIVIVESLRVRSGQAESLQQAIVELCATVDAQEPRLIAYKVYVNDDATEVTVLNVHPDVASLEHHQRVLSEVFGPLIDLVEIVRIDVCGELPKTALQQIRDMAQLFGDVTIAARPAEFGFLRSR